MATQSSSAGSATVVPLHAGAKVQRWFRLARKNEVDEGLLVHGRMDRAIRPEFVADRRRGNIAERLATRAPRHRVRARPGGSPATAGTRAG